MTRPSRTLLSLALAIVTLAHAASATGDELADIVARQVNPLVDGHGVVGCVVGVLREDEQRYFAFGEIEKGGDAAPDADTVYEIGSITKVLTGTLLADMSLRGEVALDDPLVKYLPEGVECPQFKDRSITLAHLATHTSGLPRMPNNLSPSDPRNPYADYSREKMFDFLAGHKLRRAPGQMEYSNYGMGLLGAVLAETAGQSYEELMTARIFRPLEMRDTAITLTGDQQQRLAPPYRADLEPDENWDFTSMAGAGAVRSTTRDMLKLCAAALGDDDQPIDKALRLAMEKRHGEPGEIGLGLGWHIARDGTTRWHNGRTGGYSSSVFISRPARCAAVVLANTSNPSVDVVAEKVMQAALGMDVPPISVRKQVDVPLETLKTYEGVYTLAPLFALTVTVEDGKLMVQATGQEKHQVFAESPTEFYYKVVDAQLTFNVGDNGKAESLTLHQFGVDQKAVRAGE